MNTLNDIKGLHSELIEAKSPVAEAIGDNKVDNMLSELKTFTADEVELCAINTLAKYPNEFLKYYETPIDPRFRDQVIEIIKRFRVMDGVEQQDLFDKIRIMFNDIFYAKFPTAKSAEKEAAAQLFAHQMIAIIKKHAVGSNVNMAQGGSVY